MLRFRAPRRVLHASLVVALALVWGSVPGQPHARALLGPPNIILILTDDQDLASIEHMPKLGALLRDQGTTFANYFDTTAICCPARASILTGKHTHNHGVLSNAYPNGAFRGFYESGGEASTIATWLSAAGYRTILLGKYFNGYSQPERTIPDDRAYVPPGWTDWFATNRGGGYPYRYQINDNGEVRPYGRHPTDYIADLQTRKAKSFIEGTHRPFFMYMAPHTPHDPVYPALRHLPPPGGTDAFSSMTYPRRPSFNEEDVSDKPPWLSGRKQLGRQQIDEIDAYWRQRLRALQAIDDMIESIVATLERTGKLANTYIVFTSDNGFHMGEHRMYPGKSLAYDEDIHLPLIVRGPGVVPGRTVDDIVANIDLAPTFAELAGVVPSSPVDGRSLVPFLGGVPALEWRGSMLIEKPAADAHIPAYAAIRTATHLYVESEFDGSTWYELYDRTTDPYELENVYESLAGNARASWRNALRELKACADESCRTADTWSGP